MDDTKESTKQEQTSSCESETACCKQELEQARQKMLYVAAEFDNYCKRIDKERAQWMHNAQADVLCHLFEIYDVFERALQELHSQALPDDLKNRIVGFDLIAKEFLKLFKSYDIEEISCSIPFSPEFHEAIMQIESEHHEPGEIVQVLQKGYKRKETVLRPAKVGVAK